MGRGCPGDLLCRAARQWGVPLASRRFVRLIPASLRRDHAGLMQRFPNPGMPPITPARLRELRAKAHHLHPVVRVGQHGLTPAVIREIDVNLRAHELIKVRVFSEARDERRALLERICAAVDAAPVQQIGKLLVLWRPAPESKPAESTRRNASDAKRARAGQSALDRNKGKAMAKSTPQARRPRNPVARTAARPPAAVGPRRPLSGTAGATRRRSRGRSA